MVTDGERGSKESMLHAGLDLMMMLMSNAKYLKSVNSFYRYFNGFHLFAFRVQ